MLMELDLVGEIFRMDATEMVTTKEMVAADSSSTNHKLVIPMQIGKQKMPASQDVVTPNLNHFQEI